MVTGTGEREIGVVSGRVGMYNNHLLAAVHVISTWDCYAVFEARCKKKKKREFFFSLFILFDLLLTAGNLIFDLGLSV